MQKQEILLLDKTILNIKHKIQFSNNLLHDSFQNRNRTDPVLFANPDSDRDPSVLFALIYS